MFSLILYFCPAFISFLCAVFYDVNGCKQGKTLWWNFLFIYLTLFMGLRFGVGGDTIIYMSEYEWVPDIYNYSIFSLNRYAPGFNFIMSLGRTVTSEFVGFQFIHILILNILLFSIISKYSLYRFTILFCSLFGFYYYFATEILRESLAVLIFVYFYKYYEQKEWLKYIFVVFICALMHIGALILLAIPFIKWIKFNKFYPYIIFCTILIGVSLRYIFGILNNILFFAETTQAYQADTSHGMMADLLSWLRNAGMPLLTALIIKRGNMIKFKFENMNAILIIFGCLAFFSPIVFSRICNYFIIFFIITFGNCILVLIKSGIKVARHNALIMTILFLILYGSSFVMYNYYTRLIPYYSVFNPKLVDRDNYN